MLSFSSLSLSREKSKDSTNTAIADEEDASSNKSHNVVPTKDRPRALSLTRSRSREESKDGGRSGRSRTRSTSPFRRRNAPSLRDPSPAVEALRQSQSDAELSDSEDGPQETPHHRKRKSWGIVPRRSAFWKNGSDSSTSDSSSDEDSDDETIRPEGSEGVSPDEWADDDRNGPNASSTSLASVDLLTEANTEANAMLSFDDNGEPLYPAEDDNAIDPLGEGVNVVRPEEPLFGPHPQPSSSPSRYPATIETGHHAGLSNRRKETIGRSIRLPLHTSRPSFSRDRCTVTLTHGDPDAFLKEQAENGKPREPKRYVVASDLSLESGYAVEWGIGTVLRDGDTMLVFPLTPTSLQTLTKITIVGFWSPYKRQTRNVSSCVVYVVLFNTNICSTVDPEPNAPAADRVSKLRNQQEVNSD